jgi:hypothetical protein
VKYREEPLSWYVDKLERGEPFSSLIYGDGELLVALGQRTNTLFTGYQELVTERMVAEMRESLEGDDPSILRGTDFNVLNSKYHDSGRLEKPLEQLLGKRHETLEWLNGVVWEDAVRQGELGPLLKMLRGKNLCLIGNKKLRAIKFLFREVFWEVPDKNAYEVVDGLEHAILNTEMQEVYLICMGLGATPLISRLRNRMPEATFLDMGSVFDVFVGGDGFRAWRAELYADPVKLKEIIDKNLEGL